MSTDPERQAQAFTETWYGGLLLGVRFLLEIAMLAALFLWGWRAQGVVLAVAAPVAAGALWALFVSPKARFGSPGARITVEILLFAAATVALAAAGEPAWAAIFGVVAAIDTILLRLLRL